MSESHPPDDESLDRHEAAALLGCSPNTITRLIHAGRLKAGDIGVGRNRHYRIRKSELLAFQNATAQALLPKPKRRGRRSTAPRPA